MPDTEVSRWPGERMGGDEVDARYDDDMLTIILLEFIPAKWWQHLLHNQTALLIKVAPLFSKGKAILSVPTMRSIASESTQTPLHEQPLLSAPAGPQG